MGEYSYHYSAVVHGIAGEPSYFNDGMITLKAPFDLKALDELRVHLLKTRNLTRESMERLQIVSVTAVDWPSMAK